MTSLPSRGLTVATRWLSRLDIVIVAAFVGFAVTFARGNIQFLAATMAIYGLFALATNMLVGWLGVITFGQAAFFGAGAYFVAIIRAVELPPPLIVLLAGLVGAVFAAFFAVATMRVNGIALTMLTLVFGQILFQLVFTIDGLHGDDGIPGVPAGRLFGARLARPEEFWIYAVAIVTICVIAIKLIYNSSFGRSVIAARDDQVRAGALGMPVRTFRTTVIILSGFFAAIAGGLFAQQQGIVTPENLHWLTSGNVLIMCLIGGIRSFWGPIMGAVLLLWLNSQLFKDINYSSLFIGLILLAVVLIFRGGLAGLPQQVKSLTGWLRNRRRGESEREEVVL